MPCRSFLNLNSKSSSILAKLMVKTYIEWACQIYKLTLGRSSLSLVTTLALLPDRTSSWMSAGCFSSVARCRVFKYWNCFCFVLWCSFWLYLQCRTALLLRSLTICSLPMHRWCTFDRNVLCYILSSIGYTEFVRLNIWMRASSN